MYGKNRLLQAAPPPAAPVRRPSHDTAKVRGGAAPGNLGGGRAPGNRAACGGREGPAPGKSWSRLSYAFGAIILLIAAGCGPPAALVELVAERNPDVIFRVPTEDSLVALTLDDGPHVWLTPSILDELARHDARATFFVMGRNVEGNEHILRRIVAEGHEIGNHMLTAKPSILLGKEDFRDRLRLAHEQLAPYDSIRWYRPASGWFNHRMIEEAWRMGYDVALGSVYPNDAQNPFPAYHARYVLRHVRPGSVIVLHEGMASRRRVLKTLRRILPELQRRGYRVVTLSELVDARTIQTSEDRQYPQRPVHCPLLFHITLPTPNDGIGHLHLRRSCS